MNELPIVLSSSSSSNELKLHIKWKCSLFFCPVQSAPDLQGAPKMWLSGPALMIGLYQSGFTGLSGCPPTAEPYPVSPSLTSTTEHTGQDVRSVFLVI